MIPSNRRFTIIFVVVVTVLAMLPTVIGVLARPAGTSFSGLHAASQGDLPVYFGYLQQVQDGHLLVRDTMTSEPTPYTPYSIWMVFGTLARPFDLDPRVTYHLARLVLIPLALLAWAWALKFWVPNPRRWRLALVLSVFAAGLGVWLTLWQNVHGTALSERTFAMDLWVSEAFGFMTLLHSPHFIASTTVVLLALTFFARSFSGGRLRDAAIAGGLVSLLGTFHPFHLITLAAVPLVFGLALLVRERRFTRGDLQRFAVYGLLALPGAAVYLLYNLNEPTIHQRYLQNITLTPSLPVTLVSYGLLVPFAIVGAVRRLRDRSRTSLFLVMWFVVHALLLYTPVLFQRRLTQGFEFPLILLALDGLLVLHVFLLRFPVFKARLTGLGGAILAGFFLFFGFGMSTASVFGSELKLVFQARAGGAVYLPAEQVTAFRWLHDNSTDADISIALPFEGLFAAGLSGRRTYIGHGVETLHADDKASAAAAFFTGGSSADRLRLLRENGITVVIETPRELSIESTPLSRESFLQPVFEQGSVTLYRVVDSA
jgi:uncharacterized membrane protein YhaH (DUF805 family)